MKLFAGLLVLVCAIGANAQEHAHQHAAAGAAKKAELLEGLGRHTHPIATSSEMAQKFFDQGMALVYGFNHDEAVRLFERAAEYDPKSPMPWWGIALAMGPNYNLPAMPEREEAAWKAVEKARTLASGGVEQAYVDALRTRYSADPKEDRAKLAVAYRQAMKTLAARYPDDLDAQVLYAESIMNLRPWMLWTLDGKASEDTPEIVEILEGVLRRYPDHPGANHYYIHAVEASRSPERALPSALRLGRIMPGAGHMVHMPSHIFMRVGDHEQAANVNMHASEVDRQYLAKTGTEKSMYGLMYYSHNLHFVAYSGMTAGRYEVARDYAQRLRRNVDGAIDGMPMLAQYGAYEWMVLARFGKWNEILKEPEPKEKTATLHGLYRYARGVAYAGMGMLAEAEAEKERAMAIAARIPEDEMAMMNPGRQVMAVAIEDLTGRIARAKKDSAAEVAAFAKAVELQDQFKYMEPPDWYYSMREALGAALLRNGKAAEAEMVFRKDLEYHPRNGRSLLGLREALKAKGDTVAAKLLDLEFKDSWKASEQGVLALQ